jgi:hypothetical protein
MIVAYEVSGYDGNAAVRSAENRAWAEGWTDVRLCTVAPTDPSNPVRGWTVTLLVYNQR